MGKDIKTKINININKDDSELNDFLYCWSKFGCRPNKIIIYNSYLKDLFLSVVSKNTEEKTVFTEVIPSEDSVVINDKVLIKVNDDVYLSYLLLDRTSDKSIVHDIVFFFGSNNSMELINNLINELDGCVSMFDDGDDIGKLNTICLTQNGLDIDSFSISKLDDEIDYYYTRNNINKVDKLIKSIKKDNGLSILYGVRGTGKTSIIKYISDKLDKTVIFIPNNMIDSTINNPEFINFLKKHPNPLIVIDDCEVIFSQVFSKSSLYTNNLLQLVDGPLSESINVSIIMIFNTDKDSEIDQSLLDSNSLMSKIEFEYLDEESSNELAKHIKSTKKYKNKTKLIDIIKKRGVISSKKVGLN